VSLFVEVFSIEKGCPVIINLESVIEIAPLRDGTTSIFYADTAAVGGKTALKVKDSYNMFKQFVLEPVSAEDIARRFPKSTDHKEPILIPQLQQVPENLPKTAAAKKVESMKAQNKTGSTGPGTTTADLG
jgi:uroporphyrinogen-III synthase